MERTGRFLTLALSVIGVGVITLLIVATGLGAIGRYLHINGITWSFELVGMLFLWTTAIGAVLAEIAGENVSIDGNSITSSRGVAFRVYHNLILLAVAAAMVWSGLAMLGRTGIVPTPVMRAPSWIVHSSITFMGFSLGIIAIARIVRLFR